MAAKTSSPVATSRIRRRSRRRCASSAGSTMKPRASAEASWGTAVAEGRVHGRSSCRSGRAQVAASRANVSPSILARVSPSVAIRSPMRVASPGGLTVARPGAARARRAAPRPRPARPASTRCPVDQRLLGDRGLHRTRHVAVEVGRHPRPLLRQGPEHARAEHGRVVRGDVDDEDVTLLADGSLRRRRRRARARAGRWGPTRPARSSEVNIGRAR